MAYASANSRNVFEVSKPAHFLADCRRRFPTEGLSVTTSVLGQSHEFEFQSHIIKLSIPTETPPDTAEWAPRTRKTGWRASDPDNPHTTVHQVFDIDLSTNVPKRLAIDERAFSEPPKSRHATLQQAKKLDRIADEYAGLLGAAWDHWQKMTRWVAGYRGVGFARAMVGEDPYGGNTASIYRRSDQRKIWTQTTRITVIADSSFDEHRWQLLQEALSSGQPCPTWFSFIAEAHQRFESFDHRGAIASAAIACETIVRSVFWLNAPQIQHRKIWDLVDRTSVQSIVHSWEDFAGPPLSGKWEMKPTCRS